MRAWLDMLGTPMAAPETPALRRDRRSWQMLCVVSAVTVMMVGPLVALFGRKVVVAVALLLTATLIKTVFYLGRKKRADDDFLDSVTGEAE